MKKELVIFDLDGTLIDTSRANYCAYTDAAKKYGIELDFTYDEYIQKYNGKTYKEFLNCEDEKIVELIHDEKKKIYSKYLDKCKVNEQLFKYVEDIKEEKYIVLATSASKTNTYDILKYFDKCEMFDLILTREDVEKIKPDSEIFIKAMKYFDIENYNTIVYEDSEVGVIAAKNADIKVCKVDKF